jgi:hypothetical protein
MGEAGKDARSIGKELHRSFMSVQAKAKKLKITLRSVRKRLCEKAPPVKTT